MIKAAILTRNGQHHALPRLVQILHDHPDVELIAYSDIENTERQLDEIYPALTGETDLKISADIDATAVDVVFIAADHETARSFMRPANLNDSLFIIDMSGLGLDADPDSGFVQGIPELNRKPMVRGAKYVSMPHPAVTAVVLSLLPLAKNLLINKPVHTQLVCHNPDAESNSLTADVLGSQKIEMIKRAVSTLQNAFSSEITGVEFHGDTTEGLIAVTTVSTSVALDELIRLYNDFYDDHSFTFIVDSVPDITDVRDTNKCFIHLDKKEDELVITTVLDTELKGGAGNAVHAMNLLFGLIEKVGL